MAFGEQQSLPFPRTTHDARRTPPMTDFDRLTTALADRYRIERELGRGGMAIVYLAHDLKHDREVALKVLRQEISASLGGERFLREIHTAATLNHPHIMPLLDSGEADGLLYYAMPYIEGESLAERIDREKQLPLDEARQIVREVADGLGYAHSQGVIHRDIKPENIMLSAGHAVIADFGIARAITSAGGTKLTETGIAIGTATYMSPEQASGRDSLDARSDIYSLGCVLYETLVGEPPFMGNTPQAVMARHAVDQVPPIKTVRPSVPADLENIVGKAMDKVPADRFQSAEQFVKALTGEITVTPTGTQTIAIREGPTAGRKVGLAVVAVVVAIAGTVWVLGKIRVPPIAEVDPFRLAVFPFDVQSSNDGHSFLARGLMNMLSAKLDGAGEISVVDQASTLAAVDGGETGTLAPDSARSMARQFGAGRFVLPTLLSVGSDFTIGAVLYGSTDADQPAQMSWDGSEDQLPGMVIEMAGWIVRQMGAGGEGRLELGETSSDIWAAQKAYLQGWDHLYAGRYDSAEVALEEAVRIDSAMADGWLALSYAIGWQRPGDPREYHAMQQAYLHLDRSSGVRRDVIEATYRQIHGDGAGSDSVARDILARNPDQAEAYYILAVARQFYRWQREDQQETAIGAYADAHRLHPENPVVLWNYVWALRNDRQWSLVDSLYREAEAAGRTIFLAELQTKVFEPLVAGTQERRDSAASMLAGAPRALFPISWLHQASDSVRLARDISLSRANNPNLPRATQAAGYWTAAAADVALGRWQDARGNFAAAASLEPGVIILPGPLKQEAGYPFFLYASMAIAPYLPVSTAELEAIRDSLRRWTPPVVPDRDRGMDPVFLPPVRTYLQGLYDARLGDPTSALARAEDLEQWDMPQDSVDLLADLALEIRAMVAAESGQLAEAVALLAQTGLMVKNVRPVTGPEYARPFGRLLRADLLFELGRHDEALGWYGGFPYLMSYLPISEGAHLSHIYGRMGQIYDEIGDTESAIDYYTRFVARWQDADPPFQPRVDSARVRLAGLR